MKKVLWMLVLAAFVGLGVTQSAMAGKAKGEKPPPVVVNGTVKVDGETTKLVADDAEYKAQDGRKVEVKGFVKEKDGKKILQVPAMKKEPAK
jgi:hypothetical protein